MGLLKIPAKVRDYAFEAPLLRKVPDTSDAFVMLRAAQAVCKSNGFTFSEGKRKAAVTLPNIVFLPENWGIMDMANRATLIWHESVHTAQCASLGATRYLARYTLGVGWWLAMELEAEQQEMVCCKRLGTRYDIDDNVDRLCSGKTYRALSMFYKKQLIENLSTEVLLKRWNSL